MEILCFFAGIALFYQQSPYALYFLGACLFFRPKLSLTFWFVAGVLWCLAHQWFIADKNMPKTSLIKKAKLQGQVISIPLKNHYKTQFQFLVERLDAQPVQTQIIVSCYQHCPEVHSGQRWQFQAKLKKPFNLANPGGFDYVKLLNSRHTSWIATALPNTFEVIKSKNTAFSLIKCREYLAKNLATLIPEEKLLGIFEALTLGITNHIDKAQWDLFRRTGTTHLIDISGEHIALVAGLFYWVLKWFWKYLGRLCLHFPAPKIAGFGAILMAIAYTFVAGFAVPTQRSLVTCCLMLSRHFTNQRMSTWQSWRYALFLVLLLEPHAVLMLGFYFSFIAVAILILINQRVSKKGLSKILAMQLACMLGLMPLSLYWFSYASINGLVANLLAIPWVGFLIVPLALIITFFSPWFVIPGSVFLLKSSISILLATLNYIDSFAWLNFNFHFTGVLAPFALMIAMACLIFLPMAPSYPAVYIILLASFFPRYEKVNAGDVIIDTLDVGQGLAILVRTAQHVLIYDTGMKFYHGNDMAQLAIIPYLNHLGIKQIDKVIISHPDLDHRGGLASLKEKFKIHELIVNQPSLYKNSQSCHDYPAWRWNGVLFQFFPIKYHFKKRNNNGCILKISNSLGQVLLSGDIEQLAEDYLIKTYGKHLASSHMIVPHHGSKTSSTPQYLAKIAPQYAIASYGFDNRYHFPHSKPLQAYQARHIPIYNTQAGGMIRIHLSRGKIKPQYYLKNPYR